MTELIVVRPWAVTEVALGPCMDRSAVVDVDFELPGGGRRRVPAFTSDGEWRVRYAAGEQGDHVYRAEGPVIANGVVRVEGEPAPDVAAMLPLRVASGGHYLEAADGMPFLWLADTWWER